MKKIIIILLAFLFVTNCGFTPIYSNKNIDFKLKTTINTKKDSLNTKVKKRMQIFSNEKSQKEISLQIVAKKQIKTISKDSKGDASRFEMVISINLNLTYGEIQSLNKVFVETFNYKSNTNKFELNQYEKEIEELLINKNIERIIVYLSKI
tara:strand:- start:3472 stop:3924 length:453 start_codon:yes stop_codon:yes gene_type:complete